MKPDTKFAHVSCMHVQNAGISGELVRSAVRRYNLHLLTLFDILNPKMIHVAEIISCQIRLDNIA